MIQIQRRGYFICDVEYRAFSPCVGRARPVVLISIPDGSAGSNGPPGKVGKVQPTKAGEKKTPAKEGKKQAAAPAPVKQAKAASPAAAPGGSADGDKLNGGVTAQGELWRQAEWRGNSSG